MTDKTLSSTADVHPSLPADVMADLRTDHAGETGAVWIYRGILAVSKDPELVAFARRHLEAERQHLVQMDALVPPEQRSKLLGPWRVAGFLTGALPALLGPRAVYQTIDAVETFVDEHYADQVKKLEGRQEHQALKALLAQCQADEQHHRDEAQSLAMQRSRAQRGLAAKLWCAMVDKGSRAAVMIARHV